MISATTGRIHLLLIVFLLGIFLVACEEDPTETPPPIPQQAESNTLQPPSMTQTPRVTATWTPSASPTASDTPTASNTPTPETPTATPTLTPTPPIRANVIASEDSLRVREGPGRAFDVLTTIPSESEVEVLAWQTNDIGETWYQVRFRQRDTASEDEEVIETFIGWMLNTLVEVDREEIPEFVPSPTTTPTANSTELAGSETAQATLDDGTGVDISASPVGTNTPTPTINPNVTPPAELSDVNVLAYCNDQGEPKPGTISSEQTVSIYWRWWVTEASLMQSHLDSVDYTVTLIGPDRNQELEGWEQFRTEMRTENVNGVNRPIVYWYYPVGTLEPGNYTVTYRAAWSEEHFDGIAYHGPGTANPSLSGRCTFTVTSSE